MQYLNYFLYLPLQPVLMDQWKTQDYTNHPNPPLLTLGRKKNKKETKWMLKDNSQPMDGIIPSP